LPPEVPLPVDATWRIVLLMDHREFGCANNFLQTVEKKINRHFGCHSAEITTLPSADYLYVARLTSNSTGEVKDERVLDMVIERKNVADACQCLITNSKKFKPLSFFEAQMYKLQTCGVAKKLFLMEGE
jgi:ERCC4-type nuclease